MADNPGWTVLTLKEFFDQRFEDLDRATRLAAATTDRRLASMNELREQINHERGTYLTVVQADERTKTGAARAEARFAAVEKRVTVIERWQWKVVGGLVLIAVILPAVVALVVYLLTRHAVPVGK